MVRDYATPTWVDSVHHGLITRLILEQGGFPASYAPYLDIQITEYHPGFHSVLASFIWLSGLSIDQAMLILGQVLNALAIFASYLFTVSLLSDRRAGLLAAAITGLFTPMPAYYTSWGRYTHLAGMLILPVFFSFLENPLGPIFKSVLVSPPNAGSKQAKPSLPLQACHNPLACFRRSFSHPLSYCRLRVLTGFRLPGFSIPLEPVIC